MNAHNEQQWPEYLMLRDTGLYDDAGGLGQHIFTTAGAGYVKQKYVRADLAAQPSPVVKQNLTTQPAAAQEAVGWQFWHEMPGGGGEWRNGSPDHVVKNHRKNTEAAGIPTRDVYAAPVTAAPADLIERCREILAWQRTGVLPGDALRAYATARWPDEHDPLQIAEKETAREAFRILAGAAAASTPAAPGIDLAGKSGLLRRARSLFDQDREYALERGDSHHAGQCTKDIAGIDALIDAAMQAQAGDAEVQP